MTHCRVSSIASCRPCSLGCLGLNHLRSGSNRSHGILWNFEMKQNIQHVYCEISLGPWFLEGISNDMGRPTASTLSDLVDRNCLYAKNDLEKSTRFWQQPGAGIMQLWLAGLNQATVRVWIQDQRSGSSLEMSPSIESATNCWWKGPKLSCVNVGELHWSYLDIVSCFPWIFKMFSLKGQAWVQGQMQVNVQLFAKVQVSQNT